jgi:predicted nucleotidyltransferase component of viral defense system
MVRRMRDFHDAQIVELFHLAFLQVLQTRLDQGRYVLKGGANLRYFFDSVRYSEDIDLDITGIPTWTLVKKVDGILTSPTIGAVLRSSGCSVEGFTKPKQTETTRRWKISIAVTGRRQAVRTKIEFSNRNGDARHVLEPVDARIVAPYALRAPTVQHYTVDAATEQKIRALAGRSQTQARDVFDLDMLLRRAILQAGSIEPRVLAAAAARGLELPFQAFRDQVLPFLDREITELYNTPDSWEQMQLFVTDTLLNAR